MAERNSNNNRRENYRYKPVSVPGGGFVTGFVFHPAVPDIMYCRTDIGGIYRYDFRKECWISLVDSATDPEVWKTYPLSIALDRNNPEFLYAMVGRFPTHKIAFSPDYGNHFEYLNTPVDERGNSVSIHGNAPGRSTGERLVVDPNDSDVLYMGTMENGLWKTKDRCKTWEQLTICYPGRKPEKNISFVDIDSASGSSGVPSRRIVVAVSGEGGSPGNNIRGQSVYISNDSGENFTPLSLEPAPLLSGPSDYPGYVGQRAVFLEKYLYITYAAYNIGWSNWNSYGCDTGRCYDGALYRYELDSEGNVLEALDITPSNIFAAALQESGTSGRRLGYGMGGICGDRSKPGTLICSTILSAQDTIYRSMDYGLTWIPVLSGLAIGDIDFNVSYQKPEYNGNESLIHWMSDVKINPFDSDRAFFNTGAGVFMTKNLRNAEYGKAVNWSCCDAGMEETVHLNIYSPPSGNVKLIDIIGDYGGFVFTDLDKPARNTFEDYKKDRWITAMNADYPDSNPNLLAVTPRGNWKGKTKGGLIISFDQGNTWEQLPDPLGLSEELDRQIQELKNPNVTSGWVAVSADGNRILWAIGIPVYASRLVYTKDLGKSWHQSAIYNLEGKPFTDSDIPFKVMSDRVNPDIFYGFGEVRKGGGFYISTDGGETFHEVHVPLGFPEVNLAGIDSEQHYEIRVESGKEGVIWLAMNQYGLWKITYNYKANQLQGKRVSKTGDYIKRIGLGKEAPDSDFKTLYTSGTINQEYGFYKSLDEGVNWIRINDEEHQYGDIRSISGDPRVYGRIYVATGTRGVVYGEPL